MRSAEKGLYLSLISIALYIALLLGTTFAWFSDSSYSDNNIITAGKVDIDLQYWDGEHWQDVQRSSELINNDADWDSGHAEVVYLKIKNAGSLETRCNLSVKIVEETAGISMTGEEILLSKYIYVDAADGVDGENNPFADRDAAMNITTENTRVCDGFTKCSVLDISDEVYVALVIYMPERLEVNHNGIDIPHIRLQIGAYATSVGDGADNGENNEDYGLPIYWREYLDEKIAEINEKLSAAKKGTDAFIFITDQHLDGTQDYSAEIINYISARTSINKVIFGGDILQGGSSDIDILRDYQSKFNDNIILMSARGNHDATGNLTESAYYDIMISPLRDKANTTNKLYYYHDNEEQRIRYIVTDSVASGTKYLTDAEQISWMQSRILELDEDWTTIIFHHGIWEGSATANTLTFSTDGRLIVDAVDAIYDDARCTIAGIYSGHTHRDYFGYSEKGYALVSTTLNASDSSLTKYDPQSSVRPSETTKEETLDVVFIDPEICRIETLRIGAGNNRSFIYPSNAPKDVAGVSLNQTEAATWINGNSVTLTAKLIPNKVTNNEVVWSLIGDDGIGTIQTDGLRCVFTPASKAGTATIEVKTVQGDFVSECVITVYEHETSINITGEFSWTPGSITYADGVASSQYANDWLYSNMVAIGAYDTLTFSHIQTTNTKTPLGYAFYDAEGNYISGASNGGGTYDTARKTVDIPAGAAYFRVMWMNTTHSRYDAEKYEISNHFFCYGNIGDSEPEIKQAVSGVSLNKASATLQVGSDAITLQATVSPSNATNPRVVWSIISGEGLGSIQVDGQSCIFTTGNTAGNVIIQVKTVDGEYTAECTIRIIDGTERVDITQEFLWTPGSITYADGVASSQYASDWLYSNMVEVLEYNTITFSHIQTTNTKTPLGYAFYDAEGNYISGASNGGGTYETANKTVEVPKGAVYFRVMWMNTTHSRYDAEKYEITTHFFCYGNI